MNVCHETQGVIHEKTLKPQLVPVSGKVGKVTVPVQ